MTKKSHNLFYPLGYCSRLWISSCSGPNVVRNFWRCSKKIFAKRKRVLFWAGITFKISEAWNLQVKVIKYLLLFIYFGPSINDVIHLGGIWQMRALLHKPLFSKMGDKGEGQVKNLKNWVTSLLLVIVHKYLFTYTFVICLFYIFQIWHQ